jgi:hypothetical protein
MIKCGAAWCYVIDGKVIKHTCQLPKGHGGSHESFCANWTREHERLVPSEHPQGKGMTYPLKLKPPAKSSTSVLQVSVCQRCGCKLDGQPLNEKCDCTCHTKGAR